MRMLDAYITEGALTPQAERKLLRTCNRRSIRRASYSGK
jgi:hypothetical protein